MISSNKKPLELTSPTFLASPSFIPPIFVTLNGDYTIKELKDLIAKTEKTEFKSAEKYGMEGLVYTRGA